MNNQSGVKRPESSAEKINYLVRPAKQVERKIIIETLICLMKEYPINAYQYVGMGSLFYVDYRMFHKYLGITKMISMEKEESKIERFRFNKPYRFIELKSGISTDTLLALQWDNDMFIWLDYDSRISTDVINDVKIVSDNIKSGGIVIITLDAEPKKFDPIPKDPKLSDSENRFMNLKEQLRKYLPLDTTKKDISAPYYPLLLRQIIKNVIEDALRKRNIQFFQVFNFKYADTSHMYTFGCIFEESPNRIKRTNVFDLEFVSQNDSPIELNVPIITPEERIHLDKSIPGIADRLRKFKMDEKQLRDYEKLYRYYPHYFETYL